MPKEKSELQWHPEIRDIEALRDYEINPRTLRSKEMADLKDSVDRFGLAEPVIIQPDGLIIGGHARRRILKARGEKKVQCMVPNRELTEAEVKELNVRLNKNIAGEFDLAGLLKNFNLDDLKGWGFTDDELQLTAAVDLVPDKKPGKTDQVAKEIHVCPRCGFEF